MMKTEIKVFAVIGGSALVALGVLGATLSQTQASPGSIASSEMSTGVTITEASIAPNTPETSVAAPGITGPAPLPPEEQGLPG